MTTTKTSKFKGHDIFSVFEDGAEKPIISIGTKKAAALLAHVQELTEFVNKLGEPSPTPAAADTSSTEKIPTLF